MKILCISDTTDPLVYSPNIAERYADVDCVISAGDLPLKYYEYILSSLNKPLYFVFGNHNLEHQHMFVSGNPYYGTVSTSYKEMAMASSLPPFGGDYIDGKVVYSRKNNLLVAGLGGSIRYNAGGNQFTDREMMLRILRMAPRLIWNRIRHGRYLDILVTHAPPLGINDDVDPCHTGFKAFLWFMDWFKPRYLLHGHVHMIDLNAPREIPYRSTKVINIYQNYILEDDELGKSHER